MRRIKFPWRSHLWRGRHHIKYNIPVWIPDLLPFPCHNHNSQGMAFVARSPATVKYFINFDFLSSYGQTQQGAYPPYPIHNTAPYPMGNILSLFTIIFFTYQIYAHSRSARAHKSTVLRAGSHCRTLSKTGAVQSKLYRALRRAVI